MTDLQARMHQEVCLPAKLSACLCGSYARVAEKEVRGALRFAIGELGPARRHVWRVQEGELPTGPAVMREIGAALERCVHRLESLAPDSAPEGEKGDAHGDQ